MLIHSICSCSETATTHTPILRTIMLYTRVTQARPKGNAQKSKNPATRTSTIKQVLYTHIAFPLPCARQLSVSLSPLPRFLTLTGAREHVVPPPVNSTRRIALSLCLSNRPAPLSFFPRASRCNNSPSHFFFTRIFFFLSAYFSSFASSAFVRTAVRSLRTYIGLRYCDCHQGISARRVKYTHSARTSAHTADLYT